MVQQVPVQMRDIKVHVNMIVTNSAEYNVLLVIDLVDELELEDELEDTIAVPFYKAKIIKSTFQINDRQYHPGYLEYIKQQSHNSTGIINKSESPNVSNIQLEPEKVVPIGKLEESQYQLLHQLLDKNKDLFAKSLQTPEGEHIIITEEVPPIKKRVYRTAPKKNEFIEILVVVKKKNGKLRFCINYKPLNDITKKDNYPLPRIDELLDSLQNAQWFTTLDLASGYWQIKVRAEDQEKTAFITKFGTYEFKEKFILVYHDDVIIYSKTFKDHIQHLEEVLNRIRKANLRLKAKKCHFAVAELQFLRYIVRKKGVKPDPEKVNKMVNYLEPQNIRELRRILGLFSYYQRFIKDFAKVADPMYKLLKKDAPYKWMNLQQKAFENLKDKLITAPIVQYPDFSKPFFLYTNASIIGLGAVLAQKTDDQEYVIAHASRTLIPAEKNYAITELECLAIVWAVKYF
ncbi:gag-pol fusion protein [Rhizophagus irregularis DAOM 197198w]|uniref:Gag-pol fusion protein n=1 Tax=Rhizophagus irregularis (strain DAOM 197198w) TaxID=1432141 RepID=A0A015JC54_RHIIW|nr:gag-pol fusion protein [Rhizophagus irregularis DAOM 197198w]